MKTLLFDLIATQPNSSGKFHGGGKYAKVVFKQLLQNEKLANWILVCVYDSKRPLDDDILHWVSEKSILLIDVSASSFDQIIKLNSVSRVYSALPGTELMLATKDIECYSTIHGLRFLELDTPYEALKYTKGLKSFARELANILLAKPKSIRYRAHYLRLLKSDATIVVSNHTKFSAKTYFPEVNIDNLKVFYSPDVSISNVEELENTPTKAYFLLVSGNRWIKNNIRSAKALDQIFTSNPDLDLNVIVTGVKNPEIYLAHLKNRNRFTFKGYVDDNALAHLYKNAFALIYMSLNEGFGYPPLEAMCHGTPVITSPLTSIAEICGDAVIYANPYSVSEIATRINYLLSSTSIYEELRVKGHNRFVAIKKRQDADLVQLSDFILDTVK